MEVKSIEKIEDMFRVVLQASEEEHEVKVWATRKFGPDELSCSVVYEDSGGEEVESEVEEVVLDAIEKSEKAAEKTGEYEIRHSDNYGGECIFLKKGKLPNAGMDPKTCRHPRGAACYAEWEGALGHGWYCTLCGEVIQVG